MKYIRTKDKIIKYDATKVLQMIPTEYDDRTYIAKYEGSFVYGVADTIEELCDELVVYVKDNIKAVRIFPKGKAMEYSTYLKQTDNLDSEIYGAIWTDKGLIYVAKMNESGVLELL